MEVKVVKATTFPQINRKQMSTIFVEGWYHDLKFFHKDKARLIKTFEHIFNLSCFYVGA